jgi:cytochrome b6-f complex iron-sulfur subunit
VPGSDARAKALRSFSQRIALGGLTLNGWAARMDAPMSGCSRRDLLKALAIATGSSALGCGPLPNSGVTGGVIAAGNVSALPVGTLTLVSGSSVVIARDAGGVYALSTVCTHAGCDMAFNGTVSSSGLFCGCHGSQFSPNGDPVAGPARSPLTHYAVTVTPAGALSVNTGQAVAEATRTAV